MGASKKLHDKERESEFLSDLHEPKSKLKDFDLVEAVTRMVERVKEGYEDELEIYVLLSNTEKMITAAKKEILDNALQEFEAYGEKTVEKYGKKISITKSGRYDYSTSAKWNQKKNELKHIEDIMKTAYNQASKGIVAVDENGEVVDIPIYKENKPSLRLG